MGSFNIHGAHQHSPIDAVTPFDDNDDVDIIAFGKSLKERDIYDLLPCKNVYIGQVKRCESKIPG
jgi:hypothetical protein